MGGTALAPVGAMNEVQLLGATTPRRSRGNGQDGIDSTAVGHSVKGAAEQLTDVLPRVTGVGPGTSLADKV